MKKHLFLITLVLVVFSISTCKSGEIVINSGENTTGSDITMIVEEGSHYTHPLKVMKIITVKTTPQIAVWIEDIDGNYIETIYVTERVGTQGWRKTPGEGVPAEKVRRKSSLPYWAHKRGVVYEDGLYLPTKANPLPDTITSASPKGSFSLNTKVPETLTRFVILAEFNNSGDFNEFYTDDAKPGDPGYTGGFYAGGQPAVVYAVEVDLTSESKTYEMKIVGHASPDGEDGNLYEDTSKMTTGLDLVEKITVEVK
jgi:hypothetical protein